MVGTNGYAQIDIGPYVESMEWDIYQFTIQTGQVTAATGCDVKHNGFLLCSTIQGWKDTAVGPPDCVVQPGDTLSVCWSRATPGDTATVGVWYNENPNGTTFSTAH